MIWAIAVGGAMAIVAGLSNVLGGYHLDPVLLGVVGGACTVLGWEGRGMDAEARRQS